MDGAASDEEPGLMQLLALPGLGPHLLAAVARGLSLVRLHRLRRTSKAFDRICAAALAAIPGPLALGGYHRGAARRGL